MGSFITGIFGGETNIWTLAFALLIVLILIVATVWLLKVLANASGNIARGRQRRLSVVETIGIDNKRNLVRVRRDDVEHLIIISTNSETVVESGIYDGGMARKKPAPSKPKEEPLPNPLAETSIVTAAVSNIKTSSTTPKRTPQTATRSARERFGLSRLLRRTSKQNSEQGGEKLTSIPEQKTIKPVPVVEIESGETSLTPKPEITSDDTVKVDTGPKDSSQKPGSSIKHTSLLMPISQLVGTDIKTQKSANEDNNKPSDTDSAKNEDQQIDSKAMETIEEGAKSGDETVEVKENDDDQKSDKKGD